MNADRREGGGVSEMKVTARKCAEEPKYTKTAAALLERCREFYRDPENEKAFQEWKAGKDEKK